MRKRTVSFLDLDRTLYRTDQFLHRIRTDLLGLGYTLEQIDPPIASLSQAGEYTLERHLEVLGVAREYFADCVMRYQALQQQGDVLLYDDVLPALSRLARVSDCALLTFGHPRYQRDKFSGIGSIQPFFKRRHYVHHPHTKGEVIQRYSSRARTWFLDDSPEQLIDVHARSPTTSLVRIMRPMDGLPSHIGDGSIWTVVTTFPAFVDLVEAE